MTPEQIESGLDNGELVERYVSYYGDGAVLDSDRTPRGCRTDEDEGGNTAIVRVVMPKSDYLDVWHYTRRENTGPNPFTDAYEVAQRIAVTAVETEVWNCDVEWSPAECDRLGGCFLCGGDHRS